MATHPLRMLAIDLRNAHPAAREALRLSHAELDDLLRNACSGGKQFELVVVSEADRFEIYSSEESHSAAFRAVLFELVVRAGGRETLRSLPTLEASGDAVARHLLSRAAGVGGSSVFEMLRELNVAVTRSRAAGTLGAELTALFASAIEAAWRVYTETSVGDSTKSTIERELDVLEAERIVEEELVAWKAQHGIAKSAPPVALDVSYYSSTEPGSAIRLKATVKAPAGLRSTHVA